ncbi:MAG: ribonuclease HII, partial [Oscillospiraceae bacterium]
ILNATFLAMNRAIDMVNCDFAIIDGNKVPKNISVPAMAVIKGDAKSMSVAAASILAKVTRDRLLLEYDKEYPQYEFSKHKGYGTALHIEKILKYGPSEIHRLSFLRKIYEKQK